VRFLHTSDWHLGISLGQVSLLDAQAEMIKKIADVCVDRAVDAVIIAGDVFDQSISSQDAIRLYTEAMERLCLKLGLPVLMIAGNHDGPARLAQCAGLLEQSGLYISGRIHERKTVVLEDACFHFFPFHNVAEARLLFPEQSIQTTDRAMRALVQDSLERSPAPEKKQIALAHCFVLNAVPSGSDRMASAAVGGSTMVEAAAFDGFDYVALGHLHGLQSLKYNCNYSGSPIKYSFAEVRQNKGVLIHDTCTGNTEHVSLNMNFDLLEFEDTFERLCSIADGLTGEDKFARMVMTDLPQTVGRLDRLRERFPGVISLSGVTTTQTGSDTDLSAEDLQTLKPLEIVRSFYLDELSQNLPDEQAKWFEDSWQETERRPSE
jgi:exonuclease SbcD